MFVYWTKEGEASRTDEKNGGTGRHLVVTEEGGKPHKKQETKQL